MINLVNEFNNFWNKKKLNWKVLILIRACYLNWIFLIYLKNYYKIKIEKK